MDLPELTEELPQLIFSCVAVDVLDNQTLFLHGLFELVSLFLQFLGTLLLTLELSHVQR